MEFNRQNIRSKATTTETHVIDEGLRAYMLKVYNYMTSGILLTGIISLFLFKLSVVMTPDGSIAGLTAYDTQKIKNMYLVSDSGEIMGKKAVMGALTLYLDFINLFIMLLRLFGQRR